MGLDRPGIVALHKALGWRSAAWSGVHIIGELIFIISTSGLGVARLKPGTSWNPSGHRSNLGVAYVLKCNVPVPLFILSSILIYIYIHTYIHDMCMYIQTLHCIILHYITLDTHIHTCIHTCTYNIFTYSYIQIFTYRFTNRNVRVCVCGCFWCVTVCFHMFVS